MSLSNTYECGFDEENGKTISKDTCPECTGNLGADGGEISCMKCGLIIDEERFARGWGWVSFEDEANHPFA
ncbi:hypothetical protein [Halobacterium wangiae]|uniref:hypothetical protein n=1 Tax=Halobacterium wangiae TaxID=2902623 RepID=UPI001E644BD8|nr:hypothetical protein [Halobacterium wangiae]